MNYEDFCKDITTNSFGSDDLILIDEFDLFLTQYKGFINTSVSNIAGLWNLKNTSLIGLTASFPKEFNEILESMTKDYQVYTFKTPHELKNNKDNYEVEYTYSSSWASYIKTYVKLAECMSQPLVVFCS